MSNIEGEATHSKPTIEIDIEVFVDMLDRFTGFVERHGADRVAFLSGIRDAINERIKNAPSEDAEGSQGRVE
jgi:hypothetical protein